jgi:hypothetical protein
MDLVAAGAAEVRGEFFKRLLDGAGTHHIDLRGARMAGGEGERDCGQHEKSEATAHGVFSLCG